MQPSIRVEPGILIGDLMGWLWADGVAALVIGLILATTAWLLAVETKGLLVGESAEPEVVAGIHRLAAARPAIERVNDTLTLHMGPEFILVNLSVDFRAGIGSTQVEESIAALESEIRAEFLRVKMVFVEAASWSRFRARVAPPPGP